MRVCARDGSERVEQACKGCDGFSSWRLNHQDRMLCKLQLIQCPATKPGYFKALLPDKLQVSEHAPQEC